MSAVRDGDAMQALAGRVGSLDVTRDPADPGVSPCRQSPPIAQISYRRDHRSSPFPPRCGANRENKDTSPIRAAGPRR
jgi:hypothetical protein